MQRPPRFGDILIHPAGYRAVYLCGQRNNRWIVWLGGSPAVYERFQLVNWVIEFDTWAIENP